MLGNWNTVNLQIFTTILCSLYSLLKQFHQMKTLVIKHVHVSNDKEDDTHALVQINTSEDVGIYRQISYKYTKLKFLDLQYLLV